MCLSGYSGTQLSQVRTKDATGSITSRVTTFDWGLKKLETTVDYPNTTNNETIALRNGRVEKVTTAQGLLFGVTYDQFGREVARTDPRKGDSELEFVTGSNDVLRVRNEADKVASLWTTTYTYDSSGRVATETNALGMVTRYAYSTRGELTHRWGNGATPVRFEYNSRGQRTKMHTYRAGSGWNDPTWPNSPGTPDTTEWVYAPNSGVLMEKRDALWPTDNNRKVSYTYHPDGQLNQRTWARGVTTTYNYNSVRQLTGKTYSDSTPAVSGMTYNRRGQLLGVTDGVTGARSFGYDAIGFMLSETLPAYFGSGRSVQWQRDGYGRRDSVSIFQGSTLQFSHEYDYDGATGRLKDMTTSSPGNNNVTSRVTSYEYHTNSNEWRWMRNTWAGHDVERTLESNRDAVNVFVQKTGTYKAIESTYTRDALGRLATSSRDNTDNTGFEPNPVFRGFLSQEGLAATYAYNDRDELTAEDLKARVSGVWQSVDAMGANRMSTFSYDNAQNRETANVLGAPDDPTPNALNQPNTFKGAAVSHDLDGNMTGDGTWTYAYDADGARQRGDGHAARRARRAKRRGCPPCGRAARQNRLKSSSKTGLTITYAYDFMGRRVDAARQRADGVAKRSGAAPIPLMRERGERGRVPPGWTREQMKSNFGTWFFAKRFIWDGWNLIADIWPLEWGGGIACTYVWGIDVSGTVGGAGGVGGLALMYYNGRAFIPLQDGRGNIHGYLDTTSGKNAVSWDFTAYGETIHERGGLSGVYGTQDFLFRYQSKMQDMEGHLLYFGHRFYHPGMGRFPNRDPIEEQGGPNLYAYTRNRPGDKWDLLGLTFDPDAILRLEDMTVTGTRGGGATLDGYGGSGFYFNFGGSGGGFGGDPSTYDNGPREGVEAPNNTDLSNLPGCSELKKALQDGSYKPRLSADSFIPFADISLPGTFGFEKYHGDGRDFLDSPSDGSPGRTSRMSASVDYDSSSFSPTPSLRIDPSTRTRWWGLTSSTETGVASSLGANSVFTGSSVVLGLSYSGSNPLAPYVVNPGTGNANEIRMRATVMLDFSTGMVTGSYSRSMFPAAQLFFDGKPIANLPPTKLGPAALMAVNEHGKVDGVQVCDPSR